MLFPGRDTVILLPGLARTSRCMRRLDRELTHAGYHVVAVDYPSRKKSVEDLSEAHLHPVVCAARHGGARRIHFVTVPAAHPFLMRDGTAIEMTLRFLEKGKFGREDPVRGAGRR